MKVAALPIGNALFHSRRLADPGTAATLVAVSMSVIV